MNSTQLNHDLHTLGLDGDTLKDLTLRDVIKAYKKIALKVHPDKVEDNEKEKATAEFQELEKAYRNLLTYVHNEDKRGSENMNDVEKFTNDNFQNFNFPQENCGSFTVQRYIKTCLKNF